MIRLDTTTRKLEALLGGAVTTNQLPITACWSDKTSSAYSGGTTVINSNNTTAVTIVAAPAASTVRDIDAVEIYNADTVAATITVRYNDNGTTYLLVKTTLQINETLIWTHAGGWKTVDANGNTKNSIGGILPVASGGTGDSSLTAHGVMIGEGTSAVAVTAAGTAGQLLTGQGATSDPSFQTVGGDATFGSSGTLTLATVNSNTGTFGDATHVGQFTVNGKGLITAASSVAITATVSSVGLSLPAIFTVSGSPVTTSGTLTATLATETANTVWAGPTSGAASAPTFRALVGADIPINLAGRNFLNSGSFIVDQLRLSATSTANNTYSIDFWKILTQTANINVTQQTLQENGSPFSVRLTQAQASAQRYGIIQAVEANGSQALRGQPVVLSARVRISNSQAIRYAILEWTGTADSVTTNVVNSWTSATYTAGNFFLASNLTVTAVGSITPSANTWTSITQLTGTISSSINNLLVFLWVQDTAAQNVTFDVGQVKLELGSSATQFIEDSFSDVLIKAQRYREKSFGYTTAPAQATGGVDAGSYETISVVTGAVTVRFPAIRYKVEKLTTPTITFYNPTNANAQATDLTATADCSGLTLLNTTSAGFVINVTGASSTAVGDRIAVHWLSEAPL